MIELRLDLLGILSGVACPGAEQRAPRVRRMLVSEPERAPIELLDGLDRDRLGRVTRRRTDIFAVAIDAPPLAQERQERRWNRNQVLAALGVFALHAVAWNRPHACV